MFNVTNGYSSVKEVFVISSSCQQVTQWPKDVRVEAIVVPIEGEVVKRDGSEIFGSWCFESRLAGTVMSLAIY